MKKLKKTRNEGSVSQRNTARVQKSIRRRLTMAFIGLAVGPLLLVGAISAWQSFSILKHQALNHQAEIAKRVSSQINAFFEGIENELRITGQVQGLLRLDRDHQNRTLSGLLSYANAFDELILLDSRGRERIHLVRAGPTPGLGQRSEADESTVPIKSGETYYSPVRFDEVTGEPSMTISIPLFDVRTGLVEGVLVSEVRLKKIWNLIANLRIDKDQKVYIVDAQNRIVAHRNPSLVLRGTSFEVPHGDGVHVGLDGKRAVLAADKIRLGVQELNIVSEQYLPKALAVATTNLYVISAVLIVALILAVALGFLIVRQIVGPVQAMATTAKAISQGDLSQRVAVNSRDELGALGAAFNTMTTRLIRMLGREEKRSRELHREVAQRKRIEEALRESEERLDLALSAANEGIWDWNLNDNTVIFDDRYYTMAGYDPGEFPGAFEEWEKRVHPDDIEPSQAAVEQYLAGEREIFDIEFRFRRKEGHYMWIRGQGKVVAWDKEGKPVRFIGTHSDITERKQTDAELQQLRNYLSNIIDSMPSALVGVDSDGRVTQWNQTAAKLTGIKAENAHGKSLSDTLPWMASEMKTLSRSIQSRQVIQKQKRPRPWDNGTRYEDVTIYPLITNGVEGAVIRIDDVTEKVRIEEMMVQSEKMLSVGGLAAGMAHEINNPLAGMMQTAEVMANRLTDKLRIPANREAAEAAGTTLGAVESFMAARHIPRMLATISESGRRVAAVVENMLSFARKSDSNVSFHALDQLIDKTLALAATDYDLKKEYDFKRVEIIKAYGDDVPAVPCEGAKIQQVLLNVLRNAAQAMTKAGQESPRIWVRTRFASWRKMAVMEIEDNGPGMDEATRKRVFEPFFTTKPVGTGTGLGLSVSYFIITENHHGEMAVESRQGAGTKFIMRLPIDEISRKLPAGHS